MNTAVNTIDKDFTNNCEVDTVNSYPIWKASKKLKIIVVRKLTGMNFKVFVDMIYRKMIIFRGVIAMISSEFS